MSHPYSEHRQHKVEKERVGHILGRKSGGRVSSEEDSSTAGDGEIVRDGNHSRKGTALKGASPSLRKAGGHVDGDKSKHHLGKRAKRARGGRTKGKTIININTAPRDAAPGPMAMPPPMMPPRPPMAPPGPPPGLGGPPGMPPMKRGGRIKRNFGGMIPGAGGFNGGAGVPSPVQMGGPNNAPTPPLMSMPGPTGAAPMAPHMSMPGPGGGFGGQMLARARGGAVKNSPAWTEGEKNKTPVQHTDGKTDGPDIGRRKPVTYADGGPVKKPPIDPMEGIRRDNDAAISRLKPAYGAGVGYTDKKARGGAVKNAANAVLPTKPQVPMTGDGASKVIRIAKPHGGVAKVSQAGLPVKPISLAAQPKFGGHSGEGRLEKSRRGL